MKNSETSNAAYVQMLEARAKAAEARCAELEAAKPVGKVTVKVGKSGTISVYGLQRFPVSLHPEQWARLLTSNVIAEITGLVTLSTANPSLFATKVAQAKERAEARIAGVDVS